MVPYVVLDGEGEAYVDLGSPPRRVSELRYTQWQLAIRVAKPRDVTGTVYLPKGDVSVVSPPAQRSQATARTGDN
jgi:hypothetical protein